MKITLLCENVASYSGRKMCLAEWGFSAFVETKDTNILFDTGHTDVYRKNAERLGIDLNTSDVVILSHYHWDHTGGLRFHPFTERKQLITHPDVLVKLPAEEATAIQNAFELTTTKSPLEFAPNCFYLGEIPRKTSFEQANYEGDAMRDDSAIVIKTEKGAVVVTGCSHSGICNICEYAKAVSGQPLYAVIGGFHLFEDYPEVVEGSIAYLKQENPEHLCPMHCVDFATQAKFHEIFGVTKYSAGDVINL